MDALPMRKLLLFILLAMVLVGCGTVRTVPVETVRVDSVRVERVNVQRDSVYLHDSVFVAMRGDTVTIERFRYLYRDKVVHDTIDNEHVKIETREIAIEVERELTAWQSFRLRAFWWLSAAVVALLLWCFHGPIFKLVKMIL